MVVVEAGKRRQVPLVVHERRLSEVSRPQQRYKEEVRPLSSTSISL